MSPNLNQSDPVFMTANVSSVADNVQGGKYEEAAMDGFVLYCMCIG
ncbi:hypothetical protein [Paenibacillus sp. RU26A]|nr:hypothetical protein [Paenibacillus sp. RU26A]SLJ95434.1 hypothetical protein SAMN06272722_102178 [Paenibacillus sp. RU5A]SOC67337.1 hypothetical protein SAMN05880581_102820 [Paenibacillus sp. RU26A]SOC69266.1 hypothetical protein SAMN05880586_102178 [Paenibacillus sp. RU5M]